MKRSLVLLVALSLLLSACSMSLDKSGFHIEWGSSNEEADTTAWYHEPEERDNQPSLAVYHPVDDNNPDVSRVGVSIWGVPSKAHPVRWAGTVQPDNACTLNKANWILADPGVLGADNEEEAAANPSAVWHGGAQVDNLMENKTASYLLPEAGYMKVTFPQAVITLKNADGEPYRLVFEAAENTNYTLLMRGNYDMPGDGHTRVSFVTEHPGSVKVMRYPVPAKYSGFFSQIHLDEDIAAGHSFDNCGIGGCPLSIVVLLDINDGSYGIYRHTTTYGWVLLSTNVVAP